MVATRQGELGRRLAIAAIAAVALSASGLMAVALLDTTPRSHGTMGAWGYPLALAAALAGAALVGRTRDIEVAVCIAYAVGGAALLLWPALVLALGWLFHPISNSEGDGVGLVLVTLGPVVMALGLLLLVVAALSARRLGRQRRESASRESVSS